VSELEPLGRATEEEPERYGNEEEQDRPEISRMDTALIPEVVRHANKHKNQ
jgi:hypothetical protein